MLGPLDRWLVRQRPSSVDAPPEEHEDEPQRCSDEDCEETLSSLEMPRPGTLDAFVTRSAAEDIDASWRLQRDKQRQHQRCADMLALTV